ncbi:MAG: hypothetical protein OXU61_12430 [Gammaproteobacteria bacterium]|nr:hypothetical protein [Gammaproteobacteria bacterium]
MKRLFYWFMCAFGAVCVSGCGGLMAGMTAPPQETRQAFHFDYTPSQQAALGSAGVTFAVVGSNFSGSKTKLFKGFTSSMDKDFYEVLAARGFTVRGPYQTYDELTFPDKKGSDLLLTANTQCSEDTSNLGLRQSFLDKATGTVTFRVEGAIEYGCSVSLVVAESLTNERMWTKSVNTQPISIAVSSRGWQQVPTLDQLMSRDNAFYNKVGNALRSWYPTIMDLSYTYLDPQEMAIVKQLAQEIRAKKVYAQ